MPKPKYELSKYLNDHLHYPDSARAKKVTGRVIVQFEINKDGTISNSKILKGIGEGCDEEALSVVSNMPAWEPGTQEGRLVRVLSTLPITFSLNQI